MKKLLALILTISMVASMGIAVFAEKGGFVYSPSVNPGPEIEDQEHPEDCPGELEIIPYDEREKLTDEEKKEIEEAYEKILELEEGDDLYEIIEKLAEELDIPAELILVSDLFNMGVDGCEEHAGHTPYKVKLSSDTFDDFAGLVAYKDGKWMLVDGATLDANGYLSFSYDGYGVFAVLVDTSEAGSPVTGDNGLLILCIVMMAVSAVGFTAAVVVSKKRRIATCK